MTLSVRAQLADIDARIAALEARVHVGTRVQCTDGRVITVGGAWWSAARRYVDALPAGWRPDRTWTVTPRQYDVVADAIAGLTGAQDAPRDLLIHGGRRSGKSSSIAPLVACALLLRPGSSVLLIGPRVEHGRRILSWVRSVLPASWWVWDARRTALRTITGSTAYARAADDYDAEIGAALDVLVIDEAATMPRAVYDRLAPSTYDRRGIVVMATTPRGHNWVYERYRMAVHGHPAVRAYRLSFFDNAFVPLDVREAARVAAETLSTSSYREDVEGEFLPPDNAAFADWSDDKNVKSISELHDDYTETAADLIWGSPYRWIVGVDFNVTPVIGAICKIGRDGSWWIAREVSTTGGAIDAFGYALEDVLRQLGCDDPHTQAILVADASGQYEGVHTRTRTDPPTWDVLRAQGWTLDAPAGRLRVNPSRAHRLDIARSLVCSARGRRRLFVDPSCQQIIKAFRGLTVTGGKPTRRDPHTHAYDAATYGAYRVYGTGDADLLFGRVASYREDIQNAK